MKPTPVMAKPMAKEPMNKDKTTKSVINSAKKPTPKEINKQKS